MKRFDQLESSKNLILMSMILGLFIVYPNINNTYRNLTSETPNAAPVAFLLFQLFRYLFFCILTFILLKVNIQKIKTTKLSERFLYTLLIPIIAYGVYLGVSFVLQSQSDCFTGILLFQFVVTWLICCFIGHTVALYSERRAYEKKIESLKMESLQSRCDALTNQINPHFFFNSLSGLTSLIRKDLKEDSLHYIDKLSEVFRYILLSDKKGLVTLEEELQFLQSFGYMLEVRFADKLLFNIEIEQSTLSLKLPVLSLLPIIENVVVHNAIDSDSQMEITITTNDKQELKISNPVYPKLDEPETNGTGLANINKRFQLMLEKEIRIENDGHSFTVILPLK
ncbi:histidine kinase [Parabacteroides sp. PF5-9]|uniref:sensor histidine kinase n=1 Tax=Parabacteroides sp. PF5-9 TaxID=1742404 RepID=UPI00247348F5|nr:histidine kinase [Parabacteroides sp. PF5-9]MDH6357303.1 hypothetical protein [Parabacteroides sp. PF5-9]